MSLLRPSRRAAVVGAAACLAAPAILRGQGRLTLRLAHALPDSHPVHAAMQLFADRVAARSGGAIAIALYADGALGQETALLAQCRAGALDFVKVSASVVENVDPVYRLFSLPFVFRDRDHWRRLATSVVGARLLERLETADLVGLTYYEAGSRSFYGRRAFDRPEDLKGLKIRIQPSPTMNRLIELFGAEPVALAWSVVYAALQSRLVDGAENSPVALVVGRHNEVVSHYSFDEHTMVPDVFLMSLARWRALDAGRQAILREAARESWDHMNTLWESFEGRTIAESGARGVVFTRPDKAPFIAHTEALRRDFTRDDADLRAALTATQAI